MSYTMEDFQRDLVKKYFSRLSPEEQQEVLDSLSPEKRLAGLSPEKRLAGLSPEKRLAGLSPDQIREHLERLTAGRPASQRKPRRRK